MRVCVCLRLSERVAPVRMEHHIVGRIYVLFYNLNSKTRSTHTRYKSLISRNYNKRIVQHQFNNKIIIFIARDPNPSRRRALIKTPMNQFACCVTVRIYFYFTSIFISSVCECAGRARIALET